MNGNLNSLRRSKFGQGQPVGPGASPGGIGKFNPPGAQMGGISPQGPMGAVGPQMDMPPGGGRMKEMVVPPPNQLGPPVGGPGLSFPPGVPPGGGAGPQPGMPAPPPMTRPTMPPAQMLPAGGQGMSSQGGMPSPGMQQMGAVSAGAPVGAPADPMALRRLATTMAGAPGMIR